MTRDTLFQQAVTSRGFAYAPYSGFTVGAALLAADGTVFTGCNIENASFSPTCCAERTAFFKAVSEGTRTFSAIAIVGGPAGKPPADGLSPCGVCRQVMSEFCTADFEILLGTADGGYTVTTLGALFPQTFKL